MTYRMAPVLTSAASPVFETPAPWAAQADLYKPEVDHSDIYRSGDELLASTKEQVFGRHEVKIIYYNIFNLHPTLFIIFYQFSHVCKYSTVIIKYF
jgi:hypothetical protein